MVTTVEERLEMKTMHISLILRIGVKEQETFWNLSKSLFDTLSFPMDIDMMAWENLLKLIYFWDF